MPRHCSDETLPEFYRLRREGAASLAGPVPRDSAALEQRAREFRASPKRRRALQDSLLKRWQARPLAPAAKAAAGQLENSETLIVIAGQQPALAGGPLLIAAKILSAVRLTRELERLGLPAVTLFWVAGDDHDVGELNSGRFPSSPQPDPLKIPFDEDRVPLSRLELSAEFQRRELSSRLPSLERDWFDTTRVTHMFADLIDEHFGPFGVLPILPEWLEALRAPLIAEELEQPGRLAREVEPVLAELGSKGMTPPIEKVEWLPLFFHDERGRRHRLDRVTDEQVEIRTEASRSSGGAQEERHSLDELKELVIEDPSRFSPDALLRPLHQDALIEPFATVLGPTEFGYHLELKDAYRARGLTRPLLFHRGRFRVLPETLFQTLEESGVDVCDITLDTDPRLLVPSPEAEKLVEDLSARAREFAQGLSRLESEAKPLAKRAARLDRRLQGDVEKLTEAIRREVGGSVEEQRRAVQRAYDALFWKGQPAERTTAFLWYLETYGESLLEALCEGYDPFDETASVVVLKSTQPDLSKGRTP